MLQYIEILQHLQVPLLKKARAHLCLQFASHNLDLEKVCEKTNIELFGREMLSSTKRTPSSTDRAMYHETVNTAKAPKEWLKKRS